MSWFAFELALRSRLSRAWFACALMASWFCCAGFSGCGTTKQNLATEQLLSSDAVDGAIARIDFTPLAGQAVFFETKYMLNYKGVGFVNAEYVISSLRQQMVAAGLLLQDKMETADYVVEGRVGTLGLDSHDVIYGIPSSSAIGAASAAAAAVSGAPALPGIPELSVARRNDQVAAAKIGLFAYERESKERVWQSGTAVARSNAKDLWIFGIGPFQKGTIYKGGLRFAGESLNSAPAMERREGINGTIASYRDEAIFILPDRKREMEVANAAENDGGVKQASGEAPVSSERK